MSSEKDGEKSMGYCALDIEMTGSTRNDKIIAIGIAHGPSAFEMSSTQLVVKLDKPSDATWGDFWKSSNFEWRCFEEFWSKHEKVLNELQSQASIGTVEELARQFNDTLEAIEKQYSRLILVTDTIAYDTTWLNMLLVMHDYRPLNYSRQGEHRWGYEIDSLTEGALHVDANHDWETYRALVEMEIDTRFPSLHVTHNHRPEQDAFFILARYFRVREYARVRMASSSLNEEC